MKHISGQSPLLSSVAELLKREVDLDALLGRMLDIVAAALGAERATLFLIDPASGELLSRAAHLPEMPRIRLEPGQGVAGYVAQHGALLNLPRPDADERWYQGVDKRTGFQTRSLLCLPLRLPEEPTVVGVLQILNKKEGSFSSNDEQLASALADQLGDALQGTSLGGQLLRAPSPTPPPSLDYRFNRIIGAAPPMRRLYERVLRAAATTASVLLCGESGTGKELIARAIHYNSERRDRPLVKVDCAALPASLVENELFGHAAGAYTGARRKRSGRLEKAHQGTLFLDEVGELPLSAQGKLLRFLQERCFEALGSHRTVTVDVRIISATNRDLAALVADGQFRADLYYRLRVLVLELPPLRARGPEDLQRLVEHFLSLYNRKHGCTVQGLDAASWQRIRAHRWPGNVRELEHCIEAAIVLAGDGLLDPGHLGLPESPGSEELSPSALSSGDLRPLAAVEREHVLRVLAAAGHNQSEAARILGIGRNTLGRKLRAWGIPRAH